MKTSILFMVAATSLFVTACSTTRSTQRALVGTWQTAPFPPGTTNRAIYHFSADGTYSHTQPAIPFSGPVHETKGTYSVEPGNLLVLTGGIRGLTAQQVFFKDGDLHMVVSTTEGSVVKTYKREGKR